MLYWYQDKSSVIYWNDNIWQHAQKMSKCYRDSLGVIKDQFVLAMGGVHLESKCQRVEILDFSSQSPCWIPMIDILVLSRSNLGVDTLYNFVCAIDGQYGANCLNSVEVFDINTISWQMVTSMSTRRSYHGVGVGTQNLLYVGQDNSEEVLNCRML